MPVSQNRRSTTLADPLSADERREAYADGETIGSGRYLLGPELGQGAMGKVFLSLDSVTDREVAVKIAHEARCADPNFRARFVAEAKLLARCTHPFVIPLLDHGEDPVRGVPYLVMEYMPGGSLTAFVQRPNPPAQVFAWMRTAAKALAYAHSLGVYHHDVRPTNLLLTENMEVRLADFSIATSMEPEAKPPGGNRHPGSSPPSPHTDDLHGLGMLFYSLLTGRPAEAGSLPPGDITGLHRICDDIYTRAVTEDPRQQFRGVAELDRALSDAEACVLRGAFCSLLCFQLRRTARVLWPPSPVRRMQTLTTAAAIALLAVTWERPAPEPAAPPAGQSAAALARAGPPPSPGLAFLRSLPMASVPSAAAIDRPFVAHGHHFLPVPGQPGVLLDATETRRGQFEEFAATLTAEETSRLLPDIYDLDGEKVSRSTRKWTDACPFREDAAAGINAPAAEVYCAWLTARERAAGRLPEGAFYRLPWALEWWLASGVDVAATGANWEHRNDVPWGEGWPGRPDAGNFGGIETVEDPMRPNWDIVRRRDPFVRVAPPGFFRRGPAGFYDLDGNLAEWAGDPGTHSPPGHSFRVIPGYSWMSGEDNLRLAYDMAQNDPGVPTSYRGFRVALQFATPPAPLPHLILHGLTDTSGSPDSARPGKPAGELRPGDRVRITWQLKNYGAPATGIAVRSNASTARKTYFRSPGVKGREALGGAETRIVSPGTGDTLYLSWDMDTGGWPAELIKVSASVHASVAPDAPCIETSAPGAAIPWHSRQWLLSAFMLKGQ